jgi:large subunit ribosomal protein L49
MRLPLSTPFSFPVNTCRHSHHPRFFAHNAASVPAPRSPRPPYFVPRNSRGSLPVYSDVRNSRTRYLISLRNVEGSIKVCDPDSSQSLTSHRPSQKALADDLLRDLSSPVQNVVKVRITGSNHLVLSGLRRKQSVLDWLVRHDF